VFDQYLMVFLLLLHIAMAIWSIVHALLNKRDPRSALGWIIISLFFPIVGPFFYWIFGMNRVQVRAQRLLNKSLTRTTVERREDALRRSPDSSRESHHTIRTFLKVSDKVCRLPAIPGNQVDILFNGDEAYPAMLQAIEQAQRSVYLMTYIFDTDDTGYTFIEALDRCQKRGVDVKVLIDGIGELGNWRRASTLLARLGVNVQRFLPMTARPPVFYWNLRNHRKLLVIDDEIAFTGGINISSRHVLKNNHSKSRVVDMHFRLAGPIVSELRTVFMDDWEFVTGQPMASPPLELKPCGTALCRVVVDEPSESTDRLATTLAAAVTAAKQRVVVATPYFLPSRELMSALQAAGLRDIDVTVLLPAKNDNRLVHWATRHLLRNLIQFDVKIFYQPAPFVHTKLFIIDDQLVFFGSANMDPRSLRLNFELNVEAYDGDLVERLMAYIHKQIAASSAMTIQDLEQRTLSQKIRDASAWLFSPYL
jgi:cardiolipin synthase